MKRRSTMAPSKMKRAISNDILEKEDDLDDKSLVTESNSKDSINKSNSILTEESHRETFMIPKKTIYKK